MTRSDAGTLANVTGFLNAESVRLRWPSPNQIVETGDTGTGYPQPRSDRDVRYSMEASPQVEPKALVSTWTASSIGGAFRQDLSSPSSSGRLLTPCGYPRSIPDCPLPIADHSEFLRSLPPSAGASL